MHHSRHFAKFSVSSLLRAVVEALGAVGLTQRAELARGAGGDDRRLGERGLVLASLELCLDLSINDNTM